MRAVTLVVAAVVVLACAAHALPEVAGLGVTDADRADWELFEQFQARFKREYLSVEHKLDRFKVFQANMRTAERLTAEHAGEATFGVTRFSDLSPEEFRAKYLTLNETVIAQSIERAQRDGLISEWEGPEPDLQIATSVDWNAQGKVSPVRNQGECGCCWAFTACAEYESQLVMRGWLTTPNLILSPQQLVDCDASNSGCNGGFYVSAWQYIYNNGGIMQEPTYPYEDGTGSCRWSASNPYNLRPGNGGSTTPGTSASAIYSYLASHGPSAAAIDATLL